MHHHRIDADLFEKDNVLGEALRERLVAHGVAAKLYDDDLVGEGAHVGSASASVRAVSISFALSGRAAHMTGGLYPNHRGSASAAKLARSSAMPTPVVALVISKSGCAAECPRNAAVTVAAHVVSGVVFEARPPW